jgi:hypothetical protein
LGTTIGAINISRSVAAKSNSRSAAAAGSLGPITARVEGTAAATAAACKQNRLIGETTKTTAAAGCKFRIGGAQAATATATATANCASAAAAAADTFSSALHTTGTAGTAVVSGHR